VTYPVAPPELAADLSNLDVVLGVHVDNYDIGYANAEALGARNRAYNAALDAGSAEHEIAEIRAIALTEERRGRLMDRVWSVLALIAVVKVAE
jgi:hypothetical protein